MVASRRQGGRRPTTPKAVVGLATAALAVGILTSCGDDDGDRSGDDPSGTTTADATTTTLSPEEEVEQAYLEFWDMATRLAENPDPDDPEIAERASGEAMTNLVDGLTTLRAANQRTEVGSRTAHGVMSVDIGDGTATLEDCAVDESRLVDTASDEELDAGLTTTHWQVTLTMSSDRWIVQKFETIDAWDGAVPCA